jgi:hypothetical protein
MPRPECLASELFPTKSSRTGDADGESRVCAVIGRRDALLGRPQSRESTGESSLGKYPRDRWIKFRIIRQDKMQPAPLADHHSRECLCRARHDIKIAPD